MNPLLISGYGISITVNRACLTVSNTHSETENYEFRPHKIPYDSIILDGHYGSISLEALYWLSKHDISISLINWNGNMLYTAIPKETNNAELKIKQYQHYLDSKKRLSIANQIVTKKVKSSMGLLKQLSNFYDIDFKTIDSETKRYDSVSIKDIDFDSTSMDMETKRYDIDSIKDLMMYEGRIASAYWSRLSKIFNELAPDFRFETRKNLSYSWNTNASDEINALLNYGYAVLESMIRKTINSIGLDPSIGFLHEIAPSKHPLVYDLQELFRYIIDYSVIEMLETKLKKNDFIVTENYHIRLKPKTAKLLIEKIKDNFNKRYEFRGKRYTLDNILYENVRILGNYTSGKSKGLDFNIPDIKIERVDNKEVRSKIMSINPDKRKELKINKSTLWYQQKKIKEGKEIKVYRKTREEICGLDKR